MAALTCEICGGKLVGKPGGVFECDSCGMEYSTEWAKAKIQEIRGTVQGEGTVEVTGTVKVEGGANKESLLKRGYLLLEDGDWRGADECFDQVLNIDPECAEAYVGKVCAAQQYRQIAQLAEASRGISWEASKLWNRALEYASPEMKAKLEAYLAASRKLAQEEEQAREERRRTEKERREKEKQQAEAAALKKSQELLPLQTKFSRAARYIAAGEHYTAGLKSDGTVVTAGWNERGERNVSDWANIVAIAVGVNAASNYIIGLKADGSVVAAGWNENGQCEVSDWQDITAIAAGGSHTVGLKADGTVIAVGSNDEGECEVAGWRDITAIAAGVNYTVGLKADGTVVAVGGNENGQCNVSDWRNIVSVAVGSRLSGYYSYTVGLKTDGTVVAVGSNEEGACNVSNWTDIVAVAAGAGCTIGIRSDNTVVITGNDKYDQDYAEDWTDIVAIAAGEEHIIGLKKDGTVVSVGNDKGGACNVEKWKLFNSLDTLQEEHKESVHRQEEARAQRRAALEAERTALQNELACLKGLFSGKRRKEIEVRLAAITKELEE